MIHCDICKVDYKDNDALSKTSGFLCRCVNNVCIPCMTQICMADIKPILGNESDGIMLEQDLEYKVKCPFCRKLIDPFIKKAFNNGPLHKMFLAIKLCKFLNKTDDIKAIRNRYKLDFGYDCPI